MGTGASTEMGPVEAPEDVSMEVIVRANFALVFIKPHANNEPVQAFVESSLKKTHGMVVLGKGSVNSETINEKGLIDQHYAAINETAMMTEPADLPITEEKMAEFQEKFSVEWGAAVAAGEVLNAKGGALKLGTEGDPEKGTEDFPMPGRDLEALWNLNTERKMKLAPGLYVTKVKGDNEDDEEEKPLYIINGFYPAMREKYLAEDASINYFIVAFDSQVLSWAKFREEVIGATDPTAAVSTSMRAKCLAQWETTLNLKEAPDTGNNCIHASAGPIEGLKERTIWCNWNLAQDPFGSRLMDAVLADDNAVVAEIMIENPKVSLFGKKGSLFDLTEDVDSPSVLVVANNIAYAAELEGFIDSAPLTADDTLGADSSSEDETGEKHPMPEEDEAKAKKVLKWQLKLAESRKKGSRKNIGMFKNKLKKAGVEPFPAATPAAAA